MVKTSCERRLFAYQRWKIAFEIFDEIVLMCFFKFKGRVQNHSEKFNFWVRKIISTEYRNF